MVLLMRIVLLFMLVIQSFPALSQLELLDPDSLKQQKIYTSIESALAANPDSVYRLSLVKKKLKDIPASVYSFRNLQELNLSKNQFTELPDRIGELKNLQRLTVSNNKLKAIPKTIGKLTGLVYLDFNRNLIEAIPPEIGNLINLEELNLWDNELSIIPDEIKNCGSLKTFELRGILFTEDEQKRIQELLPFTHIYFSPACNCKD